MHIQTILILNYVNSRTFILVKTYVSTGKKCITIFDRLFLQFTPFISLALRMFVWQQCSQSRPNIIPFEIRGSLIVKFPVTSVFNISYRSIWKICEVPLFHYLNIYFFKFSLETWVSLNNS